MKKIIFSLVIASFAFAFGLGALADDATSTDANTNTTVSASTTTPIVGGDRDEHGCIGSAGYSWCATLNKCIRPWMEKCEKKKATTTIDVTCMQNAIDKRDNAIIASWDKYSAALKKALETRRDALKAAAAKATAKERNVASNKAMRDYNTSVAKARYTLNKEKISIWQAYNKTKKSCKLGKEDYTTVKQDSGL